MMEGARAPAYRRLKVGDGPSSGAFQGDIMYVIGNRRIPHVGSFAPER